MGKARLLSNLTPTRCAKIERKKAAELAHKIAVGQKKKEPALKKAREEAEKAERATHGALAKDTWKTYADLCGDCSNGQN